MNWAKGAALSLLCHVSEVYISYRKMPEAYDDEHDANKEEASTQEQYKEYYHYINREKTFSKKALFTPHSSQESADQVDYTREEKE